MYSLAYLGNPFASLVGKGVFGWFVALLAGLVMLFTTSMYLWRNRHVLQTQPVEMGLIFFIAYIAMTALMTAVGRAHFGLFQVMTSRYVTPATMAWVAWGLLMTRVYLRGEVSYPQQWRYSLVGLGFLFLIPHCIQQPLCTIVMIRPCSL